MKPQRRPTLTGANLKLPATSPTNGQSGPPPKQDPLPSFVVDVMNEIQTSWNFMTLDQFNPVPNALSLLDNSSMGRDYNTFSAVYGRLEKAMDVIVNDYHQGFNNAIQKFSGVVENISDSKDRVVGMRGDLENCNEWLQNKRFDLFHLWVKSIQNKEMVRILEIIEEMMKVPDKIDSLIQGKFYYSATKTLLTSIRLLHGPECAPIGALENIRQRLDDWKTSLPELILEELQNHLYLKSHFSLDRVESTEYESASKRNSDVKFKSAPALDKSKRFTSVDAFQTQMSKIKLSIDEKEDIEEDLESNPEADSFFYMRVLVECLAMLDKLPESLKTIRDKLPLELYYVIERTIQVVDQRNEKVLMNIKDKASSSSSLSLSGRRKNNSSIDTPDLIGLNTRLEQRDVLKDLLNTLYSRLEAIIQGQHYVLFIVQNLAKTNPHIDLGDGYSTKDVWNTVQNEVRGLLYDYFTSVDRNVNFANAVLSVNELLKERKKSKDGNSKKLFRISGVPQSGKIHAFYGSLFGSDNQSNIFSIETSSPNNINSILSSSAAAAAAAGTSIIDKYSSTVSAGRRLLINPDAYNVLVAYSPTCEFMDRVEDAITLRGGTFKFFLNDFILNVFIPQMEGRVMSYFHQFVNGIDAFQAEFSPDAAEFPLIKSAMALTVLIQGMCRTLYAIPVHQEECVKMIESVLVKFYDKCAGRIRALLSTDQPGLDISESTGIISAQWANELEMVNLFSRSPYLMDEENPDENLSRELNEREVAMEMRMKKERSFHRSELVFDQRKLGELANLHYSMEWFVAHIAKLRISESTSRSLMASNRAWVAEKAAAGDVLELYSKWSSESLPSIPVQMEEDVKLPLNNEMSSRFDSIHVNFMKLSETCLFALRLEIRCHAMFYLDLATREGNYYLADEPFEPDPYVWSLNHDVTMIEETMTIALPVNKLRFLFDGLSNLMSHILCSNLKHVKRVNQNGIKKLLRNVYALQQCLTNITVLHEKGLEKARQYLELLTLSGETLIRFISSKPGLFTYDEYKVILDHIFDEVLNESEEGSPGRKSYADCLQRLKDWFVKHR